MGTPTITSWLYESTTNFFQRIIFRYQPENPFVVSAAGLTVLLLKSRLSIEYGKVQQMHAFKEK